MAALSEWLKQCEWLERLMETCRQALSFSDVFSGRRGVPSTPRRRGIKGAAPCALIGLLAVWTPPAHAEEFVVSAAASLTDAFREIGKQFEQRYPEAKPTFNFAGSGALLQQIVNGAPVDVFASADQFTMDEAVRKGVVTQAEQQVFAINELVLAVPRGDAPRVMRLEDLLQPGIERIAVANPAHVPVGRYTKDALERAGLWTELQGKIIMTQHVRQSLEYVSRGEVDAGFVYRTDAAVAAASVTTAFTVTTGEPVRYPIAPVKAAQHRDEAERFIRFVLSPDGLEILSRFGFSKP
ncbi:MAG: molybdate ABC transporter substrate-binding protein [Methylobacteriaceae bacterium]|nr:molybdate ABC transporter substrate-binding protein [Methylobacteriaceae bacterium]